MRKRSSLGRRRGDRFWLIVVGKDLEGFDRQLDTLEALELECKLIRDRVSDMCGSEMEKMETCLKRHEKVI